MKKVNHVLQSTKPPEGSIELIYGRIGNGKTAHATRCILDDLEAGHVVYANWPLDLSLWSFDDRDKFKRHFLNFLLGKRRYYKFNKSNFHYVPTQELTMEFLSRIVDADVYVDEGQWLLDSYAGTKYSMEHRKTILHTRHDGRRIVIVTQRPTAIQVSARGNVNRFYKCTKILSWPMMILRVEEFQEMTMETVDESKASRASVRYHIANKKLFKTYNSKYLRGNKNPLDLPQYDVFEAKMREKVWGLFLPLRRVLASLEGALRWLTAVVRRVWGRKAKMHVAREGIPDLLPSTLSTTESKNKQRIWDIIKS